NVGEKACQLTTHTKSEHIFAGDGISHDHSPVFRTGGQALAVRTVRNAVDRRPVSLADKKKLPGGGVPYLDQPRPCILTPFIADARKAFTIGTEHGLSDQSIVS